MELIMVPEHLTSQFNVNEVNQGVRKIDNKKRVNDGPRTFNNSSIIFSLYQSKRTNC